MNLIQVSESFNPRLFSIAKTIAIEIIPFQRQTHIAFCLGKKGRILSVGINSFSKFNKFQEKCAKHSGFADRIFLHAETDSLLKCKSKNLRHLFVVRFGKDMSIRTSKPCAVCILAMKCYGIKKIFYT